MNKSIATYLVDSFTDKPFKGNPAGVCILKESLTNNEMQSIAKELGLSETAFISPAIDDVYGIRFFSPISEINLCGHATLASSKVLFEINAKMEKIHFRNSQNLDLLIQKQEKTIAMEFPVYDTIPHVFPEDLRKALGLENVVNTVFCKELNIILVEIDSCDVLQKLRPNFETLSRIETSINGVLVTATSKKDNYDFESRYFWPWSGTNEDPVTGATHTFLTKYWSKRLGKTKMNSFQCSERTGFMEVELVNNKLIIRSQAQIVLKGKFRI